MERKFVKYVYNGLAKEFNLEVPFPHFRIYIDEEHAEKIKEFLQQKKKQFRIILYQVLNNRYSDEHYRKEPYETTGMKFKGKGFNFRIYCKEFSTTNHRHIVMIRLEPKKTQKVDKKMLAILASITNYTYKFDEL